MLEALGLDSRVCEFFFFTGGAMKGPPGKDAN